MTLSCWQAFVTTWLRKHCTVFDRVEFVVELVPVRQANGEARWMFSRSTVGAVRTIYDANERLVVEDKVPEWLKRRAVLGLMPWQWLGLLLLAIGSFVVGYILVYFFALQWHWLPVQGYLPLSEGFWPWLRHLILPSVALGMAYVALIARITRASMLEVLAEDYIRTASAKGVATPSVLLRHALKNAAVPIVTVIGIGFALLISGVVITETVFNIPGLGRLTVDAILKRDYPIIQGLIILFAGAKVLVNLLVDISYTFFDPRIRQ